MAGNASTLPLSNCSEVVVNSHPVDLVEDTGGYIIIVYVYAVLVVAATAVLYARYALSPVLLERSELVRVKLGDINTQFLLAALFSSVSIFLPASHVFSKSVLKVIFGGGMNQFLQLTMLQLGGEKELLKKTDLKVNLGSIPLCCISGFSFTKLNLTPTTFTMVRRLVNQVPAIQFTILYILMSCELSKVDPTTSVLTFLTTLQSISWLAGIWGLQMLGGLVGDSLASTGWNSRLLLFQGLAGLVELAEIFVAILLWAGALPCVSQLLPQPNLVLLLESSLVLLCCLLMAKSQFDLYNKHSLQIDEDSLGDQKEEMGKNSETKEEGDSVNLKQV